MAWTHIGTIHSGWQNNMRVESRYYLGAQSIPNNTSQILTEVFLQTTNGQSINASFSGQALAGTWGGGQTKQFAVGGNSTTYYTGYSRTVTHAADGTLNVQVGGQINTNNVLAFDQQVWIWYALPTIPRATTPNLQGGGSFVAGTQKQINLPRPAGTSFTHDVTYKMGTATGTIGTGLGTSVQWTPSTELLRQIPNSASGTVTITVVTKSGTTAIGTRSVNFTLEAAASVIPNITSVTWSDLNPTVAAAIGAFVQGQSLIKGTVAATEVFDSPIASTSVTVAGQTLTEGGSWAPTTSGTITASGTAVDRRARVRTQAANFSVLAYSPPTLTQALVRRATGSTGTLGNGTFLRMDLTAVVQSLTVASTQKNALKLRVRTRPVGGAWTVRNNITHTALTYSNTMVMVTGGGAFPTNTSFEVEIRVTDNTGTFVELLQRVGTIQVALDLAGNSVGVGKIHERGTLDVGGDVYSNDKKLISYDEAPSLPAGSIMAWGTNTPPTNWLICDGQAVSRTTYSDLFAIIGVTYGSGNGSTTFTLPDLRGRVAGGYDSTNTEFNALGKQGGSATSRHGFYMPPLNSGSFQNPGAAYSNAVINEINNFLSAGGSGTSTVVTKLLNVGGAVGNTGTAATEVRFAGYSAPTLQPSLALNYIIKASGGVDALGSTVETALLNRMAKLENRLPAFKACMTAAQSWSGTTTWTRLNFNSALLNSGSAYNTSLARFVAPVTGLYEFDGHVTMTTVSGGPAAGFYINGTLGSTAHKGGVGQFLAYNNSYDGMHWSEIFELSSGDYVEAYLSNPNNTAVSVSASHGTSFQGKLLQAY